MEWTNHCPRHIPSSWPGGPSVFRLELQPWVGHQPLSASHTLSWVLPLGSMDCTGPGTPIPAA